MKTQNPKTSNNFSSHFEQETLDKIAELQRNNAFLSSRKAVIVYCVDIVSAIEKDKKVIKNDTVLN